MLNSFKDQNRLALLALHFIPGIGNYLIRQLVSYCGSAEQVFRTPKGKLLKVPGIGEVTARVISGGDIFQSAEAEARRAQEAGVELLFYSDKHYPSRLKTIVDAPSLLYAKGSINFEVGKIVAIVGTRHATSYGRRFVENIVRDLVPHEALILSGLAYGIDIVAHRQALNHQLQTIGVLGSGIDVIYPANHTDTARRMQENGGLVSENPFGSKPDAHNFPSRNRIIAGLCDALIVVEAAVTGGALITADIANSYNKDVFAVPGNVTEGYSEGCNNLIKSNKAHLLTSVKDLEYIMNWSTEKNDKASRSSFFDPGEYSTEEFSLLNLLKEKNRNLPLDELSWMAGFPVSQTAALLLNLEFKGVVQSHPGKMFSLKMS